MQAGKGHHLRNVQELVMNRRGVIATPGPRGETEVIGTGNERVRYGGPSYKSSDFRFRCSQIEQTQREGGRKINS